MLTPSNYSSLLVTSSHISSHRDFPTVFVVDFKPVSN